MHITDHPTKTQAPNHLIDEKSPYLLQHAYNPVDWYSWSEEAFNKAESENKPIFLSIGYSTCRWCHVHYLHQEGVVITLLILFFKFVFPVHALTIPVAVRKFIQKIELEQSEYIFAIATRWGTVFSWIREN